MEKNRGELKRRVIAYLTREELEFLTRLSMDASYSTGRRLSRTDIIAALIDAAEVLNVKADGVESKEELVKRIISSCVLCERRRFPRLKKNVKMDLREVESTKVHKEYRTSDISMSGFRIDADEYEGHLEPDSVIELVFADPDEEDRPIKAIGRVVWLRKKEGKEGHEAGVRLTYMKEEDKGRFENFLYRESGESEVKKLIKGKK
jgi:hypothetical protein